MKRRSKPNRGPKKRLGRPDPQHGRRRSGPRGGHRLPVTFEVDVLTLSEDGEPIATPLDKRLMGFADRWLITAGKSVAVGDRVLVADAERHGHTITLTAVKTLPKQEDRSFIGLVSEGRFVRLMHRDLANVDFVLPENHPAQPGDYVRVRPGKRPARGATPVEVVANLGAEPKGLESMVAIENAGIPVEFPEDALAEAEGLPAYAWSKEDGRTDWRTLPIVTIDGADARDFDDAVWAEARKEGGHRIIVAIADVAHYIKEGGTLDKTARERGNSTYFPDRVVPMLPERLSNDLCSLRPQEDRPVLGVEMEIDDHGKLLKHTFHRAVIHSHARLTYIQVQAALDGNTDATTKPLLPHLKALHAAYKTLDRARKTRGALDLELPEIGIIVGNDGDVSHVMPIERLDSHKLIEELMVLANVAAATVLAKHKEPGFYRIHDRPDKMKLMTLSAALNPLGFTTPQADAGHKAWAKLVAEVNNHPASQTLLRQILQSQMQARYDLANIGHYGLALPLYAHFTSPIRRYADLVVHRALIKALKLPGNGALKGNAVEIARLGETINLTERRSQHAEWEARDRLMARYFSKRIGETFKAIVTSALNFGLFVTIEEGAEGLLPARLLGWDWRFSTHDMLWKNSKEKKTLSPGSPLDVTLIDADRVAGRLTFALAKAGKS